ncbi:MAG: hypothetical protein AAGA60_11010 [Cyanobacteria bacterium P01_E01_bin.42]
MSELPNSLPKTKWLTQFAAGLNCSGSFLQVLEAKLVEHARSLSGVDLRNGEYVFLPSDASFKICYKQLNSCKVAAVSGDLVGHAMGYPATVIWYCPSLPHEAIAPAEAIDDRLQLEAYWSEFPVEEFRDRAKLILPFIEISEQFNFQIEWEVIIWPDIVLQLQVRDDGDRSGIEEIEAAIAQTFSQWNAQEDYHLGVIHYVGEVRHIARNTLAIHIDFGSADRNAVRLLLRNLNAIGDCDFLVEAILGT